MFIIHKTAFVANLLRSIAMKTISGNIASIGDLINRKEVSRDIGCEKIAIIM